MIFETDNQKTYNLSSEASCSSGRNVFSNCKHAGYCAVIACSDGIIAVGSNKNTSYDIFGTSILSVIPKSQNVFKNDNFILVTYGDNYMPDIYGLFDVNEWIEKQIDQYKKPIELCEDLYLKIKNSKQKMQVNFLAGHKDKNSVLLVHYQISNDYIRIIDRFYSSKSQILSNNVYIGFGKFSVITSILSSSQRQQHIYTVNEMLELIHTRLIKEIESLSQNVIYNPSGNISVKVLNL